MNGFKLTYGPQNKPPWQDFHQTERTFEDVITRINELLRSGVQTLAWQDSKLFRSRIKDKYFGTKPRNFFASEKKTAALN